MSFPIPGNALPKRKLPVVAALARFAFARSGWQLKGDIPNLAKFVAVVAPHTSSWDFFLSMILILGLGLRVSWMAKHTLFRPPLGRIMRWLGGLAIDRTGRNKVVDQVIAIFDAQPALIVGLMPEGSRKRAGVPVAAWKTGFYYIALGAGVPILPVHLDNANRCVRFGPLLTPTGDIDADLAKVQKFYADAALRYKSSH